MAENDKKKRIWLKLIKRMNMAETDKKKRI